MLMTTHGDRRLLGHERRLFAAGALLLLDFLEGDPDWETGVAPFDRLAQCAKPGTDRAGVLLHVAGRFLDNLPAPVPTAWLEATVLAVYETLRAALEVELDVDDGLSEIGPDGRDACRWRRLILLAWCERCCDPSDDYGPHGGPDQPVSSLDEDPWKFKVEALEGEVLMDRDSIDEITMDIDPRKAFRIREQLGIPAGYYRATPPVLDDRQEERLNRVRRELERFSRQPVRLVSSGPFRYGNGADPRGHGTRMGA